MKNVNRIFPLFLTALLLLCGSLAFGQERTLRTGSDGFRWWFELEQDGYYGAQSINGTTLIPLSRKYTYICYHTTGGGWFCFRKNHSSTYEGCCDKNGKEIIAPERGYNEVYYRGDEGYIRVEKNGLYGACDLNGREIIAPKYESLILNSISGEFKYKNSQGDWVSTGVKYDGKTVTYASSSSSNNNSSSSSNSAAGNKTFTVNGVTFEMVAVKGGTFTMGATPEQGSDADDDEKPTHNVTLGDYYIGKFEVTQELWEAVMGSNPSWFKGNNLPVEEVSWDDCQTFIRKLNTLTGKNFRLPTEAEWEYAARGGNRSMGYKYSGSNNIKDVAWYDDSNKTHIVGTKSPNELGIYDMSSNVWEWCLDWYGSYSSGSQTNPQGPSSGSSRVIRGGSWTDAWNCRVSRRYSSPGYTSFDTGFRLALVL